MDKIDTKPRSRSSTMKRASTMDRNWSMKSMWEDAEKRFFEDTGTPLKARGLVTLEDCKEQIARLQQVPDIKSAPKESHTDIAKGVGLNILSFLKLLSGFAGQVADEAFPVSSLVFNAVSFLLDIPSDLHDFHQAIEGLFETLGAGLSQFVIYENLKLEQFNELEDGLKQAIHRLMVSFVRICGLSIKLRKSGRWNKFKGEAKRVLLQDDSGVKDEVEHFKALTEDHHNIQSTQTLKTVLDIKDTADKRNADETKNKNIEQLKQKLDLEDEPAIKLSKDLCEKHWRDRLRGTASWIETPGQQPEFHKWAERKETNVKPLFTLTGNSNTGKSVIASSVVYHLKSIYESPARKLERTIVANYFFPSYSGKNDIDKQPVHTALKCIAVQIAEADSQYAATIVKACNAKSDLKRFLKDATCQSLWDFLLLGAPSGKTTYYFVFDGVESLPEEAWYQETKVEFFDVLRELGTVSPAVRVFLTQRPNWLGPPPLQDVVYHDVLVEDFGTTDINLYIDDDLRKADILQGEDEYRIGRREIIRDRLANDLGGNYYKIITALDEIKKIVRKTGKWDDIMKVFDGANEDEQAISARAVRELEASLDAEEIKELNELMTWVEYACQGQLSISLLETALILRFDTPLLSLEKKLRGKYSRLFDISGSQVMMSDGMLSLIHTKRTAEQDQEDETKFSLTITINKANLKSVQQFLWSLSMKASQDNFGFLQLEDKSTSKGTIRVNRYDSRMAILRRTFDLLAAEPDKQTRDITSKLVSYLPQHLEDPYLQGQSSYPGEVGSGFTPDEKKEIGCGLYEIFRKGGQIVQRHWGSFDDLVWYRDKDEIDVFLDWFRQPVVVSRLGYLDRRWLKEVTTSSNPYRALLMNIEMTVAENLFCRQEWDVVRPFNWIWAFIDNLEHERPKAETNNSDQAGIEPEDMIARIKWQYFGDDIQIVSAWCQEVLRVVKTDDCWNEKLAELYYIRGPDYDRSVSLFRSVVEGHTPTAKSLEGLAKSLAKVHSVKSLTKLQVEGGDYLTEACQSMEKALTLLQNENTPDKLRITSNYVDLARWYQESGDWQKGIACLQKALDLDHENNEALYELLCAWFETENGEQEGVKLLHRLVETKVGTQKQSQYSLMMAQMMPEENHFSDLEDPDKKFARLLWIFSSRPELAKLTLQEIDQTIDRARETNKPLHALFFLFHRGLASSPYHYQMADTAPNKTNFDYWAESLKLDGESSYWMTKLQVRTANFIAAHHYEGAVKALEGPILNPTQFNHLEALRTGVNSDRSTDISPAKSYLTWYYTTAKRPEEAKRVVRDGINLAFDMLSDHDDENDLEGYTYLGYILMQRGDALNALTAFSLLLPCPADTEPLTWMLEDVMKTDPERAIALDVMQELREGFNFRDSTFIDQVAVFLDLLTDLEEGAITPRNSSTTHTITNNTPRAYTAIRSHLAQFTRAKHTLSVLFRCSGCGIPWDFQRTVSFCRCCYNVIFCADCAAILKRSGRERLKLLPVETFTCSERHELLRMPSFNKERCLEVLRGDVWVGGELGADGERVGGRLVGIRTWLDGLMKEWEYTPRREDGMERGLKKVLDDGGKGRDHAVTVVDGGRMAVRNYNGTGSEFR